MSDFARELAKHRTRRATALSGWQKNGCSANFLRSLISRQGLSRQDGEWNSRTYEKAVSWRSLPVPCSFMDGSVRRSRWRAGARVHFRGQHWQDSPSLGLQGKYVVLEWHNRGCPYTRKYYQSGNMQRLQKEWTVKGVVWLTVISSAPGMQGFVTPTQENDYLKRMSAAPTAVLIDPSGTLSRLYGAKTTPHMFVIGPGGTLIYNGAIDDHPTTDRADLATSKNYVSMALDEAMTGKPVTEPATRPYGCPVKYAR